MYNTLGNMLCSCQKENATWALWPIMDTLHAYIINVPHHRYNTRNRMDWEPPTQSREITVAIVAIIIRVYRQLKTTQKNTLVLTKFQGPPTKSKQLHKNASLHFTSVSTETLILPLDSPPPRQHGIFYITSIVMVNSDAWGGFQSCSFLVLYL